MESLDKRLSRVEDWVRRNTLRLFGFPGRVKDKTPDQLVAYVLEESGIFPKGAWRKLVAPGYHIRRGDNQKSLLVTFHRFDQKEFVLSPENKRKVGNLRNPFFPDEPFKVMQSLCSIFRQIR